MQRIDAQIAAAAITKDPAGKWRTKLTQPAVLTFGPDEVWRARMKTTKGELQIRLLLWDYSLLYAPTSRGWATTTGWRSTA